MLLCLEQTPVGNVVGADPFYETIQFQTTSQQKERQTKPAVPRTKKAA
jgi:hypothetical protein